MTDTQPDRADAVRLPSRLEMRTVGDLADRIGNMPVGGAAIRLQADGVDLVTASGVQVLLAACNDGHRLTIENPSRPFLDCIALLGVSVAQLENGGAQP